MNPEERLDRIEKTLAILARQQLTSPIGGSVIDIQARSAIVLIQKALKDTRISL